jgi:hypothetical protein
MSQVGHIVAVQHERHRPPLSQLEDFGPDPYPCDSSVNGKTYKHRRLHYERQADDSIQSEGRIFAEMVSRAGVQPNRINMNIDAYSRSFLDKMMLEAVRLKSSCV